MDEKKTIIIVGGDKETNGTLIKQLIDSGVRVVIGENHCQESNIPDLSELAELVSAKLLDVFYEIDKPYSYHPFDENKTKKYMMRSRLFKREKLIKWNTHGMFRK